MADTAGRRPRRTGGVPNNAHDGGNVEVSVADGAVKPPECGALTDHLTRCTRPPEPETERCAEHGGDGAR